MIGGIQISGAAAARALPITIIAINFRDRDLAAFVQPGADAKFTPNLLTLEPK